MSQLNDEMLTPPEVARRLRIKAERVRDFIKCGLLRAINVASPLSTRPRWRIHESDLLAFENSRSGGQRPKQSKRRPQNQDITEYF